MSSSTQPTNSNLKLILASQSPQRKRLIETLNIPFTIDPADIDEKLISADTFLERARLIAYAKGEIVRLRHPKKWIIAADTFATVGEKIFEKPKTKTEAKSMLKLQSGQLIAVCCGFYCARPNGSIFSESIVCYGKMRQLSAGEIDRYVNQNPVTTWAGAYSAAFDAGLSLFGRVEGSVTAFTHGLPMELVHQELKTLIK